MKKKKKSLPEDLIVEILLKLPVKSLLRFRCVCKSWCNLIKSPNFIQRHLKNQCSTKNDSIIIIRGCLDLTTSLSFHDHETLSVISPRLEIPELYDFHTHVCGPCNGLLCISDGETSIVLCNPAMRELKVLPPRPCPEGWEYRVRAIGFGFNSSTNDYKVVTFLCFYPSEEGDEDDDRDDYVDEEEIFVCEIYNLSTNTWREIDQDHYMPYIDDTPLRNGTLINGAFHWLARSKGNGCILSFNMNNEVFRDMELPDPNDGNCERLMVLNESLALFTFTWSPPEQQFVDIWVMHQYGVAESWTKQFAIGPVTGIVYPLLLWKNEAILVESFEGLESSEGELVSCALDTHEMDAFEIYGFRQTMRVMVYQESLVSIK